MTAIDTNLLVYAHRSATQEHLRARAAIERAASKPAGWGFSLPTVSEFWGVVTHPAAAGRPSTGEEAASFLRSLVREGGARIWLPTEGFAERLLGWARQLAVGGGRIFDLQIALIAWENGAREIWTHDKSFACPPDLHVFDPL